jgi:hypothetical protein
MQSILKRLRKLADDELLAMSEAIDLELEARLARTDEEIPESARSRANDRQRSYRRSTGAAAPPIVAVGLGKNNRDRRAA